MSHTQECQKQIDERTAAREAWLKSWPNYCKTCDGAGGASSPGDSVPYGSTWVSLPDMFDPCPDCAEKGICSRCGEQAWGEFETLDEQFVPCPHCGWDGKDQMPAEPECICYFMDGPDFNDAEKFDPEENLW